MHFSSAVIMCLLLRGILSANVKDEAEICPRFEDCLSCAKNLCTWYTNTESSFCAGRNVDERLYLFKARKASACAHVDGADVWSRSSLSIDASRPHDNQHTVSGATGLGNEGKHVQASGYNTPYSQQLSSGKPREAGNGQQLQEMFTEDHSASGKENDKMKGFTKSLKAVNCRQFVLISQQISQKKRDAEKLFRKCLRRT